MPISFEDREVVFIDDAGSLPTLRYPLVVKKEVRGEVVAATWQAPTIPTADGELAYHLYEGASHANRALYQYWNRAGFAGCVMNSRNRLRLGVENDPAALVREMFAPQV